MTVSAKKSKLSYYSLNNVRNCLEHDGDNHFALPISSIFKLSEQFVLGYLCAGAKAELIALD